MKFQLGTTTTESSTDTTTTNSGEDTTTTTNNSETTTEGSDKGETTTAQQENTTTTSSEESTTTQEETTTKKPNNGNSSCPPLEEGQAYFVCPTGFRRHPQDCNMFYQCTESPETSHYSIVTFKCPNDTVYDEEQILCRDRTEDDNCQSKMSEKLKILTDLEDNTSPAVSYNKLFLKVIFKIYFSPVPNSNKTLALLRDWPLPDRRR